LWGGIRAWRKHSKECMKLLAVGLLFLESSSKVFVG